MAENSNKRAAEVIGKYNADADAAFADEITRKEKAGPFSEDKRIFKRAYLEFSKKNIQIPNTGKSEGKDAKGNRFTKHRYPELSVIVEKVRPALADCDLIYSWESEPQPDNRVKVTCLLEHVEASYAKLSTAMMEAKSGKSREGKDLMSPGQAMVAATTFCRRVTLLDVTGLVGDVDLDGEGLRGTQDDEGHKEPPLYTELLGLLKKHADVVNEAAFLKYYKCSDMEGFPRDEENLTHAIKTIKSRVAQQEANR